MRQLALSPGFISICLLAPGFGFPNAATAGTNPNSNMSIVKTHFGTTRNSEDVDVFILKNANGLTAKVINYGAIIYSLEVPDAEGHFTNVTANCETVADYEKRSPCFGALIGRYANRIANGRFMLDGREIKLPLNGGKNHIHGGPRGFDKRVWKAEPVEGPDFVALKLSYLSKDGEEGYPGALTCTVRYELNNRNEWRMEYGAQTDKPTIVNIANHAYWNLAGAQSGDVLDHVLTLNADKYLPADETLIPTGELAPVKGTPLDFRTPHAMGERIRQITDKQFNGGYDHCLVVNHKSPGDLVSCARVKDPKSGRTMEVFTTAPGVQIFSANFPSGAFRGPNGYSYPSHCGLCLETQNYPDSPNKPQFPSPILRPGQTYHAVTIHKFGVEHQRP